MRGLPMIWASTQCCCLLCDTPRCILLWALPDNMLLGSARVRRVEFSHFMVSGFSGSRCFPTTLSTFLPVFRNPSPLPSSLFQKNEASPPKAPLGVSGHLPYWFVTTWLIHHLHRFQPSGPRQCCYLFIYSCYIFHYGLFSISFFFYAPLFQTALTCPPGETVHGG